ncbi:unnamed protein product [Bemisia tabaci]|uniref:Uncharacterized protein n=1 Tax=Bemisia tabaci TaxID=7038 RepID=A0A9P0F8A4_BEMTA|nr:unnamed protein product [Bemisia tabaci]
MLVLFTLFFIYNCKCTKSMTAALGCSIALIFISIEASPTPVPQSKSYDELLDTLRALETNRKSLLKKAVEEAANQKCNGTSKFLEIIEIADEVLVSIRDYFEAGKLMLDLNKGKLSIYQPDVIAPTPTTLHVKNYDELLESLRVLETDRKALIRGVIEKVENSKSNLTSIFLKIAEETDDLLVKIRNYFDAGKLLFDVEKGKSKPAGDFYPRTQILQIGDYLQNKMIQVAANLKTLEAQMEDLATNEVAMMRPVINILNKSDQALIPITRKFVNEMGLTDT